MTWNYRICRKKIDKIYEYGIYEAHYTEGRVAGITEKAMEPFGESLDELKRDFEHMRKAFELPVIDYKTMKEIEVCKQWSKTQQIKEL